MKENHNLDNIRPPLYPIVPCLRWVLLIACRKAMNELERKIVQRLGALERIEARILEQLSCLQREEAILRERLWQVKERES